MSRDGKCRSNNEMRCKDEILKGCSFNAIQHWLCRSAGSCSVTSALPNPQKNLLCQQLLPVLPSLWGTMWFKGARSTWGRLGDCSSVHRTQKPFILMLVKHQFKRFISFNSEFSLPATYKWKLYYNFLTAEATVFSKKQKKSISDLKLFQHHENCHMKTGNPQMTLGLRVIPITWFLLQIFQKKHWHLTGEGSKALDTCGRKCSFGWEWEGRIWKGLTFKINWMYWVPVPEHAVGRFGIDSKTRNCSWLLTLV